MSQIYPLLLLLKYKFHVYPHKHSIKSHIHGRVLNRPPELAQ